MSTRRQIRAILALTLATAAILAVLAPTARADVTIGQKTSMTVGGMNIDVDSVERTTADKQRTDSTTNCQGFLSLFCRDMEGGRIVRLDKQVEWQLQPKKKLYSERPFPTAEQRAEAQKQLEATMEEMKKCPMPQAQSSTAAPDTSRCQMSTPVVNVNATGEHATILGHDASKTSVVLSQTCTDTQTGDVCEIDYGFETWLTADEIAGAGERSAFVRRYLQAQGLDPNNPQLQRTMQQFMAPYAQQLMQLQGKAADLKGFPLRTSFYMAFGGPHCSKAQQAAQQQASSGGSGSSSSGFSMHSIASKALAGGFAGLFHHGAAAINSNSAGGAAAAGAANQAADPAASAAASSMTPQSPAGSATSAAPAAAAAPAPASTPGALVRVVSLTTETTSIDTSSIPSEQFDIPADWTLEPQKQVASSAPKCPNPGK